MFQHENKSPIVFGLWSPSSQSYELELDSLAVKDTIMT